MGRVFFPHYCSGANNTNMGYAIPQKGLIKLYINTPYLPVHPWLVVPNEKVHKSNIGITCPL